MLAAVSSLVRFSGKIWTEMCLFSFETGGLRVLVCAILELIAHRPSVGWQRASEFVTGAAHRRQKKERGREAARQLAPVIRWRVRLS